MKVLRVLCPNLTDDPFHRLKFSDLFLTNYIFFFHFLLMNPKKPEEQENDIVSNAISHNHFSGFSSSL